MAFTADNQRFNGGDSVKQKRPDFLQALIYLMCKKTGLSKMRRLLLDRKVSAVGAVINNYLLNPGFQVREFTNKSFIGMFMMIIGIFRYSAEKTNPTEAECPESDLGAGELYNGVFRDE